MNKLVLVLGVVAVSSPVFAYDNDLRVSCEYGSDNYVELIDLSGDTIELCVPDGSTSTNVDLSTTDFIIGYSGTTPITEPAHDHVQIIELHSTTGGEGYGVGVSAYLHSDCTWSVEDGAGGSWDDPDCFDNKRDTAPLEIVSCPSSPK